MISVVVALNGTPIDPGLVIADIAIRSGRTRSDDGLSASSATIELLTPDPAGIAVGIADTVRVTAEGHPRFQGRISEITRASMDDPLSSRYTLVAVGPIARLPRVQIPMPMPAATANARVAAVFAAAGIPVAIQGGESYALADYGAQGDPPLGADQVISGVMNDTGLVVADLGDGSVLAQFLDSRLSGDQWTPAAALTHVELAWEQTDDLVNDITVSWPGPPGQDTATSTSADSIARYGRHATSLQTGLGSQVAVQERATSIVARLAYPAWQVGKVETWDPAMLEHAIGAVVTLEPLPASSPVTGSSWQGVLEGWTESYGPDAAGELAGTWELALSDLVHSSQTLAWANVSPPALTWAQVDPQTAWNEAISNADL